MYNDVTHKNNKTIAVSFFISIICNIANIDYVQFYRFYRRN